MFENLFDLNPDKTLFDSGCSIDTSVKSFLKLPRKKGMAILRLPSHKFRPHHADGLHLDIWQNGINYIRGSGSFSYADEIEILDQFSGTKGQSTIHFDGKNQMPRISRFLFGSWLKQKDTYHDFSDGIMQSGYN